MNDVAEMSDPEGDPAVTRLRAEGISLAYDQRTIVTDLDVAVPDQSFTAIVGGNGCGKSTLLRGLARMLAPKQGTGLLPQGPIAPDGITVADLVGRGRYPHQGVFRQWSQTDEQAVTDAMAATGVTELAEGFVDELSGGQRQRVWLAMALAQQTPIMLLDEPTTFLDIAHQVEVLDLCADLHEHRGHTLVVVLHDLNHACRYATHLIAMRDGGIVAEGHPTEIVTADLVEHVFGLRCRIIADPETGTPLVIPAARRSHRVAAAPSPPRPRQESRA